LLGEKLAEELVLRRGEGGRHNYKALKALGREGITGCLNSWPQQPNQGEMTRTKVRRFVAEFLKWDR